MTEFFSWLAYEQLYGPIHLGERLDILHAKSDWLFAEANRNRKKPKRFTIFDFLPSWWDEQRPKRQKSSSQIWAIMKNAFPSKKQ